MRRITLSQWRHLALASLCIPLGLLAKQRHPVVPEWISHNFAGAIYVMWWCFLAHALLPRTKATTVAAWVLAATCVIEFAQLWHPPFLTSLRATLPGRLVLGNSFAWDDFPFYFAGAAVSWLVSSRNTAPG